MGVVNVTPDSFSDGGLYFDTDKAVAHGLELVGAGRRPRRCRRRVDAAGGTAADRAGGARPRRTRDPGAGGAGRPGQRRHHACEGRDRGGAGRRRAGQRRQRWPRRPGHARHGRPARRALRAHALAGPQQPDAGAHLLPQTSSTTCSRRSPSSSRRRPRPASPTASPSTRASGSPRPGSRTGTVLRELQRFHELGHPVLVATSRKRFLGELLDGRRAGPRARRRHDCDDRARCCRGCVVRPGRTRCGRPPTPYA